MIHTQVCRKHGHKTYAEPDNSFWSQAFRNALCSNIDLKGGCASSSLSHPFLTASKRFLGLALFLVKLSEKQSTASPRAGAGPLTDATDQAQRGLIIRHEHACKFFQPDKQGRLKTMELRQHNLRCVPQGGCFWVAARGQGKNDQGVIVFKLLGCVQFEAQRCWSSGDVLQPPLPGR